MVVWIRLVRTAITTLSNRSGWASSSTFRRDAGVVLERMRMRVALFGGSFDPPHHGHIAIATAAADVFDLEKVLFAPVGRQPLKPEGGAAPFADRLAMVELACRADERFAASDLDAP